jgi:hypothetical protein
VKLVELIVPGRRARFVRRNAMRHHLQRRAGDKNCSREKGDTSSPRTRSEGYLDRPSCFSQ